MKVLVIERPWEHEPVEVPWNEKNMKFYELEDDVELLEAGATLFVDNVAYSIEEDDQ